MPKKPAKKTPPSAFSLDFQKTLLVLLVLSLLLLAFTLFKTSGLKSSLSLQKDNLEDTVKGQLAPAKLSELNLKAQKADLVLRSLNEAVQQSEGDKVLKTATTLRGDVEDMWRDLVTIKSTPGTQALTKYLTAILTTQASYLQTAQSKLRGSNLTKLKLEINLTNSLLNTISSSASATQTTK